MCSDGGYGNSLATCACQGQLWRCRCPAASPAGSVPGRPAPQGCAGRSPPAAAPAGGGGPPARRCQCSGCGCDLGPAPGEARRRRAYKAGHTLAITANPPSTGLGCGNIHPGCRCGPAPAPGNGGRGLCMAQRARVTVASALQRRPSARRHPDGWRSVPQPNTSTPRGSSPPPAG